MGKEMHLSKEETTYLPPVLLRASTKRSSNLNSLRNSRENLGIFSNLEDAKLPKLENTTRKGKPKGLEISEMVDKCKKSSLNSISNGLNLSRQSERTTAIKCKAKDLSISEMVESYKKVKEKDGISRRNTRQMVHSSSKMNLSAVSPKQKLSVVMKEEQSKHANARQRKLGIIPLPPIKIMGSNENIIDSENTNAAGAPFSNTVQCSKEEKQGTLNEYRNDLICTSKEENVELKTADQDVKKIDETPPKRKRKVIGLADVKKRRIAARERAKNRFNFDRMNFDASRALLSPSATLRGIKKLNASEVIIYRFRLSNYKVRDINIINT